jgi:hypothetical protein
MRRIERGKKRVFPREDARALRKFLKKKAAARVGERGAARAELPDARMGLKGAIEAQSQTRDVLEGVQTAELRGRRSRSAVFLIHGKGLGLARGRWVEGESAKRLSLSSGCYHRRSVNVL